MCVRWDTSVNSTLPIYPLQFNVQAVHRKFLHNFKILKPKCELVKGKVMVPGNHTQLEVNVCVKPGKNPFHWEFAKIFVDKKCNRVRSHSIILHNLCGFYFLCLHLTSIFLHLILQQNINYDLLINKPKE